LRRGDFVLYRLFDEDKTLLRVGVTNNWPSRKSTYFSRKTLHPWLDRVAHTDLTPYESREAALKAEKDAIQTEHPLFNVGHNGKFSPKDSLAKHVVALRLTAKDFALLKSAAKSSNKTFSDWARQTLLRRAKTEIGTGEEK
jgi:excinuclease UvrABC nuclease subunit